MTRTRMAGCRWGSSMTKSARSRQRDDVDSVNKMFNFYSQFCNSALMRATSDSSSECRASSSSILPINTSDSWAPLLKLY